MATAAQIAANHANARRSTGPRTAEGKAASARNATSHGLSSKDFVVLAGQEQEFAEFMAALETEIQPAGAIERELFAQHAHAAWTLRRCRRAEVASQLNSASNGADPLLAPELANQLKHIDLYLRRAERTFHKSLKELRTFQTNRFDSDLEQCLQAETEAPTPAVLVDVRGIIVQRAAAARAQAVLDEAARSEYLEGFLAGVRQEAAQPSTAIAAKQTQSAPPAAFTAGGSL
jgi:hypothetical protein